MTMLQSYENNLFTSIFTDQSQYASSIIKLLLVLESENLIPLFELNNIKNGQQSSAIEASVIDNSHNVIPVKDIILQFGTHINPLTLFFGSHFQIELRENWGNDIYRTFNFNSFLIFTRQGLILEYPNVASNSLNTNRSTLKNSHRYSLMLWEDWQDINIEFAQNSPECTLIFTNSQGHHLKINNRVETPSEVQQIEQQLPLLFCYFVMKNFWKYIEKLRSFSLSVFNPDDFLYLDQTRLAYFIKNILSNINISEKDLDSLVRRI